MKLLVVLGIALAVVVSFLHTRRRRAAWSRLADELGLLPTTTPMYPMRMSGTLFGHPVEVARVTSGSGGHSRVHTRYKVAFAHNGIGFQLRRQGKMSGFLTELGGGDLKIGDSLFDRALVVRGGDAREIAHYLTPARRAALLPYFGGELVTAVRDGEIECTREKSDADAEVMRSTLRQLAELADVLAPSTPTEPSAQAPTPPQPEPEPERPSAALADDVPAAPVVEEARIDAREVSGALFAGGLLNSASKRTFEERYAGRSVRWSGTLKRASTYSTDLVFGRGEGTRAEFRLHEIGAGVAAREVLGVVQLAPEAARALCERRGDHFTFEGRLVRADPFLRTLFLADGVLL